MHLRSPNFPDMFERVLPSSSPMPSAATSSKAVLAALRALQDKIKRLEHEKNDAIEETARLRLQIHNQNYESGRFKERDSLTSLKNLHEVRAAYERILTEKSETETRLLKLEERNKAEEKIALDLRAKIRIFEDEKHSGILAIKELESERTQLQSQILHIQQKEKDLGETIMWETKCREDDMDVLSNKLLSLQDELSNLSDQKNAVQSKLFELDSLVGQLLIVNESLVARLAGKQNVRQHSSPTKSNPKSPTSSSTHQKQNDSHTNRHQNQNQNVPSSSRSSNSSSRQDEYETDNGFQAASINDNGHLDLRNMHRMYVDLAKNINIYGVVEEGAAVGGGSNIRNQEHGLGLSSSQNCDHDYEQQHQHQHQQQLQQMHDEPAYEYDRSPHSRFDSRYDTNHYRGDLEIYYGDHSSSSTHENKAHTALRSQDFGGVSDRGLQGVINSLEDEFYQLSNQYKETLSNIKAKIPGSEIPLEEELLSIIQRLHKKGEQLKTLKSPAK